MQDDNNFINELNSAIIDDIASYLNVDAAFMPILKAIKQIKDENIQLKKKISSCVMCQEKVRQDKLGGEE